jgi:hypothetical protein
VLLGAWVFLLSILPIIILVQDGKIPNTRGSFTNIYAMDSAQLIESEGPVTMNNGVVNLGNLNYSEPAEMTFRFNFWQAPYFNERARSVSSATLQLQINKPVSSYAKLISSELIWNADHSDWIGYAGSAPSFQQRLTNNVLDLSAEFDGKTRYYTLLQSRPLNIQTGEDSTLFVEWRSTDHVARLEVETADGALYRVLADSPDGTTHSGTVGGAYSPELTQTFYQLPSNVNITRIVFGLDTGGGGGGTFSVNGTQHVYFERIALVQAKLASSSVEVSFNNATIFKQRLVYPQRNLFTINPDIYPGSQVDIEVPIDVSTISQDNRIKIGIGPQTELGFVSARIRFVTIVGELSSDYLGQAPIGLVAVVTITGLILTLKFLLTLSRKSGGANITVLNKYDRKS